MIEKVYLKCVALFVTLGDVGRSNERRELFLNKRGTFHRLPREHIVCWCGITSLAGDKCIGVFRATGE